MMKQYYYHYHVKRNNYLQHTYIHTYIHTILSLRMCYCLLQNNDKKKKKTIYELIVITKNIHIDLTC